MKTKTTMIVAMDKVGAIGNKNTLPWSLPSDLAFFKEMTSGKVFLMGKNTFLSLPKRNGKHAPLPNRLNLVMTRRLLPEGRMYANLSVIQGLVDFWSYIKKHKPKEVIVMGGATVYEELISYCDEVYVTHVDTCLNEADAFFSMASLDTFPVREAIDSTPDERDEHSYQIIRYSKY